MCYVQIMYNFIQIKGFNVKILKMSKIRKISEEKCST